jgi:hypothetical protein
MQNIVPQFFRMEGLFRLYHWNTRSFARHKASCKVIGNITASMDSIVETLLGHVGRDLLFLTDFKIQYNVPADDSIITTVQSFMTYLQTWDTFMQ